MTGDELRAIFAETGPDFSAEVSTSASLDDLSAGAIDKFRQRWAEKTRDSASVNLDRFGDVDERRTADRRWRDPRRPVPFRNPRALGRWLAQAEVVFEYRSSEASGPASDRTEYREGLLLCHDRLWTEINSRNDRQSLPGGLFRTGVLTFDEASVRESC